MLVNYVHYYVFNVKYYLELGCQKFNLHTHMNNFTKCRAAHVKIESLNRNFKA